MAEAEAAKATKKNLGEPCAQTGPPLLSRGFAIAENRVYESLYCEAQNHQGLPKPLVIAYYS
ncbi:hypothetical protein CA51_05430 [Rosistilla oblonga]|nr:hypothetical protein CA51_05430 [Rosistilla oblonga]